MNYPWELQAVNLQFAAKLPCTVTLFIAVHGNKQLGHRKTVEDFNCASLSR